MDALSYTAASTSAFLTQGYAVLLPIVAACQTRRTPRAVVWLTVFLVVLGGAILAGIRPGQVALGRGELETLAATVAMTAQIVVVESPRFAGNDPLPDRRARRDSAGREVMLPLLSTGRLVPRFLISVAVTAFWVPPSWRSTRR